MSNLVRLPIAILGHIALGLLASAPALAQASFPSRPLSASDRLAEPRHGDLTEAEMALARTAWSYFEANTQEWTGLVNAADGYPSTTMWDTGSYLAALVSARELGLIDDAEVETRLDSVLRTLESLDLFRQSCPNKAYDTRSALSTDYANQAGEIGCSALDLGRLLVGLKAVEQRFPDHASDIHRLLTRWDWCNLVPGTLQGATLDDACGMVFVQEGRLGYEEYAARAFGLWGFDASKALDPEPYDTIWLYDVEIPYDSRDPRLLGAHNYVVTESYGLWGLEFGLGEPTAPGVEGFVARAAQNIYEVQRRRAEATGILTARTEHQLLDEPFFVYDTIYSDGRPWATITDSGSWVPEDAAVALKGALSLWALWESPYTGELFDLVAEQAVPGRAFYEGVYEDGRGPIAVQTANNNGIILEALRFKVEGPLIRAEDEPSAWARGIAPEAGRCLPAAPAGADAAPDAADGEAAPSAADAASP